VVDCTVHGRGGIGQTIARNGSNMSTRYNNGSHYENHQRAAELHDGAAHAHRVGEEHGKQEYSNGATTGHGMIAFGHDDIVELAHKNWVARGCPEGSPEEDWFRAVEELRSRNIGH
jgi:hypothetical protein